MVVAPRHDMDGPTYFIIRYFHWALPPRNPTSPREQYFVSWAALNLLLCSRLAD